MANKRLNFITVYLRLCMLGIFVIGTLAVPVPGGQPGDKGLVGTTVDVAQGTVKGVLKDVSTGVVDIVKSADKAVGGVIKGVGEGLGGVL